MLVRKFSPKMGEGRRVFGRRPSLIASKADYHRDNTIVKGDLGMDLGMERTCECLVHAFE